MARSLENITTKERMHRRGICVVIPTYNNSATLGEALRNVLQYCGDVIVVNDGSTDKTQDILSATMGIRTVSYSTNKGKGYALKYGLKRAKELGFAYAITMDADGQHYAKDITAFLEANCLYPGALIVGNRKLESVDRSPGSVFANKFSNFWFFAQTLHYLPDTQTGFRLYPLRKLYGLDLITSRYEAETELLVLSSWHGVNIHSIPIDVYYPPRKQRVSHFRPLRDFARISLLNTLLCLLAIVYALPCWCVRTLLKVLRNVYSLLFFLFFSLFVFTPLAWFRVNIGKMTEEKRLWLHKLIQLASRIAMIKQGIPGVKFTYKLSEEVDFNKPHIIICNHQSHLDLACQLIFTPKIIFLTNDWVWNNPFYGFLIRNSEYLPVRNGIKELMPHLRDLTRRGYSIAVYPEGTRSKDFRIARFHRGAFYIAEELGMDILPMVLYGTGRVLTKKEHHLHSGHIHIEIHQSVSRQQLREIGSIRERAKFLRRWYEDKYGEIKDEIDKYV
ncbi:MAG: glycosyltransferase [Prevotellaceae bacterium]|nr:glycosyltransferase [Prevotellaceae bacterium]